MRADRGRETLKPPTALGPTARSGGLWKLPCPGAYFRRIVRPKDGAVAIFATARKLAILVYRMLRYGQDYVDVGESSHEARFQTQRLLGVTKAAGKLGFKLVPAVAEA